MTPPFLPLSVPQLEQRLRRLLDRIQQLPHRGSRPLTVGGLVAGWITAKATRSIRRLDGVRIEDEAVHIGQSTTPPGELNQRLALIAEVLRDAGCLRGWRNELLDVVGEGRRIAVIERAAMRPLGLLTYAVHLNAWTPDGRLWVAQRSPTKSTDPGLWDTLVGGLSGSGENLDTTLLRESNEEAGLLPQDMQNRSPMRTILRMHKRLPEGFQVEDILVSECVLPDTVTPRNLDGEVSDIRALPLDAVSRMLAEDAFTLEAELVVLDSLLHAQRHRMT